MQFYSVAVPCTPPLHPPQNNWFLVPGIRKSSPARATAKSYCSSTYHPMECQLRYFRTRMELAWFTFICYRSQIVGWNHFLRRLLLPPSFHTEVGTGLNTTLDTPPSQNPEVASPSWRYFCEHVHSAFQCTMIYVSVLLLGWQKFNFTLRLFWKSTLYFEGIPHFRIWLTSNVCPKAMSCWVECCKVSSWWPSFSSDLVFEPRLIGTNAGLVFASHVA